MMCLQQPQQAAQPKVIMLKSWSRLQPATGHGCQLSLRRPTHPGAQPASMCQGLTSSKMRMPKDQMSAFRPASSWRYTSGAAHRGENCPCAVLRLPCISPVACSAIASLAGVSTRPLYSVTSFTWLHEEACLAALVLSYKQTWLNLAERVCHFGALQKRGTCTPWRPRSAILAAPKVDSSTLGLLHSGFLLSSWAAAERKASDLALLTGCMCVQYMKSAALW